MKPYTAEADPRGEARVAADLEKIIEAVLLASQGEELLAIVLLGGYARGEGAVVWGAEGGVRGFNDYDLLLVFEREPLRPERYRELSRRLATELEIDFVDLGLVARGAIEHAPATLFWYELGEAHRILWQGEKGMIRLPRFRADALEAEESSRLLTNRGMALLWGGLKLWPEAPGGEGAATDSKTLRFCSIASHKAVLAAGDAALLRGGLYTPLQEERQVLLSQRGDLVAWAPEGFTRAYARAVGFRRDPKIPHVSDVASLWESSRLHHEAGFRASEEARLGRSFENWNDHARMARAHALSKSLGTPRQAARTIKRGFREGAWLPTEERFFVLMPRLLYGATSSDEQTAWRRKAEETIQEWHP